MAGGDEEHCICRSRDSRGFMICCDKCNRWFHGDCMKITQTVSKNILHFYCPPCIQMDPLLKIVFKETTSSTATNHSNTKKQMAASISGKRKSEAIEEERRESARCGQCIGCFRNDDCGKCDGCRNGVDCRQRVCVNAELMQTKKPNKHSTANHKANVTKTSAKLRPVKKIVKNNKKSIAQRTTSPNLGTPLGTRSAIRAYQDFLREAHLISDEDDEIRQCLGPKCTRCARASSKYCSDDCGFALARERLKVILPGRAAAYWTERPQAEILQEQQLMDIQRRQQEARSRLAKLDEDAAKLDQWIKAIGQSDLKVEEETEEEEADQQMGFCLVCGMECAVKLLPKHVARCSAKYDSQSSYGSAFKAAHNPYNLFCDTFNKSNNTYCKRLRIICSEHSKPCRGDEEKLCGCPLEWRSLELPDLDLDDLEKPDSKARFCAHNRRSCRRHYQWDRMAQALIDSERLTVLFRLDELLDEERALRVSLVSRGSVVALLTHNTVMANVQCSTSS